MFRPPYTRVDEPARLAAYIAAYPFGILTTIGDDGEPLSTHVPFLFRLDARAPVESGEDGALVGMLLGHVANANPHWKQFDGGRIARVIFAGPHAYVSPSLYGEHPAVPTWNYVTVHAIGRPRALHDSAELWKILEAQIAAQESGRASPWRGDLPDDYRRRMIAGIVGIAMPVERLEGKFKLSQNRSPEDRQRVMTALSSSAHSGDQELAAFMQDNEDIVFPERRGGARSLPSGAANSTRAPKP